MGDLLFAIVNLSRHLDIDPENSLNKAINKFSIRFNKIEKKLSIKNIKMESLTLEELDKFWNQVKEKE